MEIKIIIELEPEWVDEDHEMGITEEGHDALMDALMQFGGVVDIGRA